MQGEEEAVIMIKGKRSKRPRPSSPLGLAILATSSSSTTDRHGGGGSVSVEFSGCSAYSGDQLTPSSADEEDEDLAHCLILLSGGGQSRESSQPRVAVAELYQCKTCNKSFPSFQALGGHRSSHKKTSNKPMIFIDEKPPSISRNKQESSLSAFDTGSSKCRIHECSLCGAEFTSGQALGGHMRRHRPIPQPASSSHGESQEVKRPRNLLSLDLNLPAQEDIDRAEQSSFPLASKEEVIVFSNSSLIDCHY
ncbi:Nucleic acid binding protein [Dorcoceras hygrometricum]|uniref:Nucleic acid binding protein n=1 Tax=Dorcoceras hygrometricum TaxID=472368 RepID=A0A2Z7B3A6_9LAMI|nr:Nucleic acid binding protein [Dorcoceras hygrometricum]